jgi:hypothetical protein
VYLPKEFVVLEGDRGHHMYILIRGVCEVRNCADRGQIVGPCRAGAWHHAE